MSITRKLAGSVAALATIALLAGCAGGASGDKGSEDNPIKIGVVGESDAQWPAFTKAAKDAGINVKLVDFAQYEQPNPALAAGEIDLNQFQHLVYLGEYNEKSGSDLTPIGSTAIYPLGLYSSKYDSVDEIPAGSTVAVSSDPSNQARGLLVLQSAGLISLSGGGNIFSGLDEVDTAASKVKVTELEPSLTATSLPDVAAAVINNDFVAKAGLKEQDAIAQDDPNDEKALPYANVFVSRAEDKDNETYKKLVSIFQDTASVQEGLQESSGDTAIPLKTPVDELAASLAQVEKDVKANK